MLQLGYILLRLCEQKGAPCTVSVRELERVLTRLWREQRYMVYSNPRDLYQDIKLLAHMLGAARPSPRPEVLVLDGEGLEKLRKAVESAGNLVSRELRERLEMVILGGGA